MIAASRRGFALPAVLSLVTILTLVYLTCILALRDLYVEARRASAESDFERAAMTAEARMAFLVATEPLVSNALRVGGQRQSGGFDDGASADPSGASATYREVRLDGRPYQWHELPMGRRYIVSLQDTAGLINLPFQDSRSLVRLFLRAGLTAGDADRLADQFLDYFDVDDFERLLGAEFAVYRAARRPEPLNRPMRRVDEVHGMLDWERLMGPRWRSVSDWVTAQSDNPNFNINTAPAAALSVVFGLTPAAADQAVAQREMAPFDSPAQIGITTTDAMIIFTFPNGRFRFRILDQAQGFIEDFELTLTPEAKDRPVWVEPLLTRRIAPSRSVQEHDLPIFPWTDLVSG